MQFKHSLHFWAKSMKNPGPSDFRMFRIYSAVRFMLVFFSLVGFLWIIRSNAIHGCSKKYSFLPSRKNARLSSDIRIKSNISTSYLKKITRFSGNIRFPQRANLSDCGHVFGRISIFIAIVEASFKTYVIFTFLRLPKLSKKFFDYIFIQEPWNLSEVFFIWVDYF